MQLAQACRASTKVQTCRVHPIRPLSATNRLQYHRCPQRMSTSPSRGTVCCCTGVVGSSSADGNSSGNTKDHHVPEAPEFQTAWPWEFMGRKPGVQPWSPRPANGADWTPHLLMAVKLAHYFTFVAQGGVSWMLFQAAPWLMGKGKAGGPTLLCWWGSTQVTPLTELGVFLLVLGSVYQAMAGAFFILAHEYDGWQIATYVWPEDKQALDPTRYNDDRLRLVSYQFLWMFQALGMGMSAFAITQAALLAAWPLLPAAAWSVLAAVLLTVWFSCSKWVPSTYFSSPLGPYPIMLTPVYTMAIFISAAAAYCVNLCCLLGNNWLFGLIAVVFFIVGGLFEAFGAEGSLHQGYHLAAVMFISAGAVLLMVGLQKAARHFVQFGNLISELQLPWFSSSVQWWLGLPAVVAGLMIWHGHTVPSAPVGRGADGGDAMA